MMLKSRHRCRGEFLGTVRQRSRDCSCSLLPETEADICDEWRRRVDVNIQAGLPQLREMDCQPLIATTAVVVKHISDRVRR